MINHFSSWASQPFAVVDLETTGPDPATASIVEIAIAVFIPHHAEPITFASLVNPGCPIPPEATEVHGITDADVADAPTIDDVLSDQRFVGLLGDMIPCAFNEGYDRAILQRELVRVGAIATLTLPVYRWATWLDPLVILRHDAFDRWVPGKGRHKLGACCERWGVPHESAHRARGDAVATGKLLRAIVAKEPSIGQLAIGEMIRRQRIHAERQQADYVAWKAKQEQAPAEGER